MWWWMRGWISIVINAWHSMETVLEESQEKEETVTEVAYQDWLNMRYLCRWDKFIFQPFFQVFSQGVW